MPRKRRRGKRGDGAVKQGKRVQKALKHQLRQANAEVTRVRIELSVVRRGLNLLAPGLADVQHIENFDHCPYPPHTDHKTILTGADVEGYRTVSESLLAFYDHQFAILALFKSPYLDNIRFDDLLDFVEELAPMMPTLSRYAIASKGHTAGCGATRKYEEGYPMKDYKVKEEYRTERGETLRDVRPDLYDATLDLAKLLTKLLARCWPRAFVERVEISQRYRVPLLGDSFTCCFYITVDFQSAIHRDADKGSALAVVLFLERHTPTCTRPGHSCRKNWFFVVPELGIKIALRHGMAILWDSEWRFHGTVCEGQVTDGCASHIYACVNQLKTRHYRDDDESEEDATEEEES